MATKSIQTNAKTPSDTVVPQLRQEKKVSNHKNQRNEGPTAGLVLVIWNTAILNSAPGDTSEFCIQYELS